MANIGYTSYTDYILTLTAQWPELKGLHDFLRQRPHPVTSSLDLVELSRTSIEATRFRSQNDVWRDALHDRPDDVKARVWILSYSDPNRINREMLDAIALFFDLDPFFLWNHLDVSSLGESKVVTGFNKPILFPSRTTSLEVGFRKGFHASVCYMNSDIHASDHNFEAFILCNEIPRGKLHAIPAIERPSIYNSSARRRVISRHISWTDRYLSLLRYWDQTQLDDANHEPYHLLLPFLRLIALKGKRDINAESTGLQGLREKRFRRLEDFDFQTSVYDYALGLHKRAIHATLQSIKYWTKQHYTASSDFFNQLNTTIEDFEHLLAAVDHAREDLDRYKSDYAMIRSLEDSQINTQRSDSAARLTSLGFVFIPLSLVTSIFGMNVQELGSGNVKIWIALTTAIVALIVVFLLWALLGWFWPSISSLNKRLSGFGRFFRHWKRFAAVAPLQGLWLVLFMLTNPPDYYELYIKYLGLDADDAWAVPRFYSEQTVLHERLTSFWLAKGYRVCDITRIQGWDRNTVPSRLWKKIKSSERSET